MEIFDFISRDKKIENFEHESNMIITLMLENYH